MAEVPDFYEILGVSPSSDEDVIRAAYKALMRKFHPDRNMSADATQRAAEINSAWAVIGDPAKRAAYDRRRADAATIWGQVAAAQSRASSPPPRPSSPPQIIPPRLDFPLSLYRKGFIKRHRTLLGSIGVALALAMVLEVVASDRYQPAAAADRIWSSTAGGDRRSLGDDEVGSIPSVANVGTDILDNFISSQHIESDRLASGTGPPELSYGDIEKGVGDFVRIKGKGGLQGAQLYSESCHKAVDIDPVWSKADMCAAFDSAAFFVDRRLAVVKGTDPNGYFVLQKENQADNYRVLGVEPALVSIRLETIQRAASRAVYFEIRNRTDGPKADALAKKADAENEKAAVSGN
ncbi:J domain-containing protein [Flavisphingomonas formosensis]|uniref:J domain-containing protein n=1 Tax=Flavisphingomonas formosensis TaxID=861534 RepID=UPI0012F7DD14|nr:DnaJ domain-containing protein [Sphingomonas formosensis]